jgi:hypothetical protein
MANPGAASLAALSPARAAASRRNGAKSRGPKTPEGKARSAMNALMHGLCAGKAVVIGDEDWDLFDALEAALIEELAPQTPMQAVLARRIVLATWRLERVERMEGELLAQNMADTASFGLGLSRDCNGPRAFNTLLRYRNSALAEFWRCRRDLEALQAKAAKGAAVAEHHEVVVAPGDRAAEIRFKPKTRKIPDESAAVPAPVAALTPAPTCSDSPASDVSGMCGATATEPVPAPVATCGSALAYPVPQQRPGDDAGGSAPAPGPVGGRGPNPSPALAPQRIEPEHRTNPGGSASPRPRSQRAQGKPARDRHAPFGCLR